jgi:DNA-binding transcriptional LysR family regulator
MELRAIDFNLLVALDALLTERNVSRAGERLGLSQPATSLALRRLRGMFGDELLVRVGREFHRTQLAEHLAEPLHEALRIIEELVEYRPEFAPETDRRVFRIAASDALEFMLIKPLLDRIGVEAPGVSIQVQPFAAGQTFTMGEAGDLDLILYPMGHFESNLVEEKLFSDRWICAVWSRFREVGDAITYEQFASFPAAGVNWTWHDRSRQLPVEGTFHTFLDDLHVPIVDPYHFLRLFLLRGTNMVTLTYEKLACSVLKDADIRIVEPQFEVGPVEIGMMWHPQDAADPGHRWLREQLMRVAMTL